MFFKKPQPILDEELIAENYLRNLNDFMFDKTIKIIRVYREADKRAEQIEEEFSQKFEQEFEKEANQINFEEIK